MRRSLAATCAVAVAVTISPRALQPPVPGGVVTDKTVMITMRDGVALSTHIYRPARAGIALAERLPVLLHRTPYVLGGELAKRAEFFAQRGYVSVLQNIRGRYDSGGSFVKYDPLGAQDGYDTVEWLARLPYADGHVRMWGTSYAARTQADAAKMNPPSLRALLLNNGGCRTRGIMPSAWAARSNWAGN